MTDGELWAIRDSITCAAVAWVLLAGCGESHGVDGGDTGATVDAAREDDAGVPEDARVVEDAGFDLGPVFREFCERSEHLRCAGSADCCGMTDPSRSACSSSAEIEARCAELADDPALRDGTLIWNEVEAARHLREFEAAAATCSVRDRRWSWQWSYGRVVTGTLNEGEDCTPSRTWPYSLGFFRCITGLRCELTGSIDDYQGHCAPLGQLGDSCNHDCAADLYCDLLDIAGDPPEPFWGYCEPVVDGGECYSDLACSSTLCVSFSCYEPTPADTWCNILG